MLGAKLIALAASIALAAGVQASEESLTIHLRLHKQGGNCPAGQSPMSVEGVQGVYCVSGQSCVAEIKGACPGEQAGLQYGAYCDRVKTGVYGCKPKTKEMWDAEHNNKTAEWECDQGWTPMSVEGVAEVFCVQGQACAGTIQGACPGPQDGLPHGSSCGTVKTGVLGCKPNSKKHHHKKQGGNCPAGQSPMSVEGVQGVYCVSGQSCVAEIKGACPGEQAGLQYGAYCDRVKTGVYGCKPKTKEMWDAEHNNKTAEWECDQGWTPMSVEGVAEVFCVQGQACAGTIQGACPGPQDGLPHGSSCGTVKTGVLGCKPNSKKHHHKKQGGHCSAGQSPMSVEGVPGVFCVSGQSCVANINGNCPGPQAGLPNGAYCGKVKTGVMGCKPKTH